MGRPPATLLALTLAAIAGCLAGCATRAAGDAHSALPVSLQLQRYVGRLRTIQVMVAGQPMKLLLDTGGGLTFLSPNAAQRVGCTPGRNAYGFRMSGERVEFRQCGALPVSIAGQPPQPLPIHEFDLNRLLPPGLPALDGLLALDALADQPFTLDLAHDTLTLESAASLRRRTGRAVAVPMRLATGVDGASLTLFVNAVTGDGQSLWLELDSGNLAPVQLAKRPQSLPVAPGAAAAGLELVLGALHTEPLEYEVRDLIHDGALNAQFLERHALTVDIRQRRAWFEP